VHHREAPVAPAPRARGRRRWLWPLSLICAWSASAVAAGPHAHSPPLFSSSTAARGAPSGSYLSSGVVRIGNPLAAVWGPQLDETPTDTPATSPGPAEGPDWPGITRDTVYFVGYQFVGIAILYTLPESVTNWSAEDKDEYSWSKWRYNVTHPQWDDDDWWINYITHPYWGAAYFVRARERGFDGEGSFWYSALMSAVYEFGAEALFEQASIQDLIATPVLGSILGYYFMELRDWVRHRPGEPGLFEETVLILTDPLGTLNGLVDNLFGVNAQLTFGLSVHPDLLGGTTVSDERQSLELSRAAAAQSTYWGLQLRVPW
jgi:hypothetical protein